MTELLHNPKIKPEHLARKAIVYLRQSSDKQVRQNKESQLLQYAMAERVRALGWQEVEIINNDLGSSAGLAAAQREGFERVLSSVALGEVGIVGSREVSRLSRTDKDWCRLLEVCQIFGTLIADEQQVYDLNNLDDQLVLGIKGTLSVVELKVIRQRMLAGQEAKARRGELFKRLPIGYPATPWVRSCFIPTDGSAKRYSSCSPSFENCGACVRHSNGSVITTWSYRSIPYRERG
jgi:DNA invertase Pin-like site-specific DNA recombinase